MQFAWLALAVSLFQRPGVTTQSTFDDLVRQATAVLDTDPQKAADLCRQALALNPAWAEGWFDLGASLYKLSRYPEAQKAFQQAAQLAPQKGAVWAFLGLAEHQLHDDTPALSHLRKGESLGLPDNRGFVSVVHNCAAAIYIQSKDYSSAIEQLQPLALLGDDSPQTIEAFGVAALGLPYLPPDIPAAKRPLVELAGRAAWAISADKDRDATQLLQQLLAQYSNEPGVHYLNAMHLLAHDPEAARSEFQKELQISPDHVAARLQIAILDIRAGDPAAAVTLAREALRLQPDNALGHAALARAYMQQNDYPKALPELQAAARIAPLNPQIHLYLEQVYRRLGKPA